MFKIGEIVVYQNLIETPEFNGEECEIIVGIAIRTVSGKRGVWKERTYLVKDRTGVWGVPPANLRRKKPRQKYLGEEMIRSMFNSKPIEVTA